MECGEWDRIERLAQIVSAKWRSHPLHPDLLQEMRLYVWQNREKDDRLIQWMGKHRAIDFLRQTDGRKGKPDYLRRERHALPGEDFIFDHAGATVDQRDTIMELGLTGRHELIARMIEVGYQKQEIAEAMGLHPSRVSQILGEMRYEVTRTLTRAG